MTKSTLFNELHLKLMIQLWNKKKILLDDYLKMLADIGIDKNDVKLPSAKYREGVWHVFRVKNSESHKDENDIAQHLSKLFDFLVFEKEEDKDFLVSVEPSSYLCDWLRKRNRTMEYKEMGYNRLVDPILEKIVEIGQLFKNHRKRLEDQPVLGTDFLIFLEEIGVSPFIWFYDYRDRLKSSGSSTILHDTRSGRALPFGISFRSEKSLEDWSLIKSKSLGDRTLITIRVDDL